MSVSVIHVYRGGQYGRLVRYEPPPPLGDEAFIDDALLHGERRRGEPAPRIRYRATRRYRLPAPPGGPVEGLPESLLIGTPGAGPARVHASHRPKRVSPPAGPQHPHKQRRAGAAGAPAATRGRTKETKECLAVVTRSQPGSRTARCEIQRPDTSEGAADRQLAYAGCMVANGYPSSFEVIGAGAWGPSAFVHVSHAGPLRPEQAIAPPARLPQEAQAAVSTSVPSAKSC
jgi:hypothetical protein